MAEKKSKKIWIIPLLVILVLAGCVVIFTIVLSDGSQMEITAYNPFVIIDGVGYKCKYEPCEELNNHANRLLNNEGEG